MRDTDKLLITFGRASLILVTARIPSMVKVMFSVCLSTGGPPGQGLQGPQVKIQVKVLDPQGKVWGAPGQGPGCPPVKVQVKVWVGPPGQGMGPPSPKRRGRGRYGSCSHAGGLSCCIQLIHLNYRIFH